MTAKAIIAIMLCLIIVGGAIFLQIRKHKKK